jgi:hypothetical protein
MLSEAAVLAMKVSIRSSALLMVAMILRECHFDFDFLQPMVHWKYLGL